MNNDMTLNLSYIEENNKHIKKFVENKSKLLYLHTNLIRNYVYEI